MSQSVTLWGGIANVKAPWSLSLAGGGGGSHGYKKNLRSEMHFK